MKQSKKENLSKFNKDNIILAAEKLFIEYGYEKSSMDDVSKASEYSKSTVYVYFKSKEEIYNYIILKGMNILKEKMYEAVNKNKDIIDRYFDLCFAIADFQEKYPLHFDGVIGNISIDFDENDDNDVNKKIYIAGEEINEISFKLIKEGMDSGILRKELKLPETVFMFWASLSGIVKIAAQKTEYIVKQMQTSKDGFLQYSFKLLLDSIRRKENE